MWPPGALVPRESAAETDRLCQYSTRPSFLLTRAQGLAGLHVQWSVCATGQRPQALPKEKAAPESHPGRRLLPLTLRTGGTDGIRLCGVQFPGHNKGSVLPETSHPLAGARCFSTGDICLLWGWSPKQAAQDSGGLLSHTPWAASWCRGRAWARGQCPYSAVTAPPHQICQRNSQLHLLTGLPAQRWGGHCGRHRGTCPSSRPPGSSPCGAPPPARDLPPPPAPFRSTDKRET